MRGLRTLIADILGVDTAHVSADTGPGTLPEWDSMAHMQLVAAIEEHYGVRFTVDEIPAIAKVEDIAGLLRAKGVGLD